MCEWDIETNPRPKKFYQAKTVPPSFEIPGSATDLHRVERYKPISILSLAKLRWFMLTRVCPSLAAFRAAWFTILLMSAPDNDKQTESDRQTKKTQTERQI